MKVGVLVGSISRRAGGLFFSVRHLSQALASLPHVDVQVFSIADSDTRIDAEKWRPLPLNIYQPRGPAVFGFAPEIASALGKFDPDLVHAHGIWQATSISTLCWRRRSKRPYMVSPRGMLDPWALSNSRWKKRLALTLYQDQQLHGSACLHALGESELASFRTFGLRNPVAVVPNGVLLPSRRARPAEGPRRLVFLGRFHAKKGLGELIQGWKSLSQRERGDWRLVLAGWDDRGYAETLRRQVDESGVGDSVDVVGPKFELEKEEFLAGATALALTSHSEGMPMAVLEAWSYGLPVLMTDACNLPEGFAAGAAVRVTCDAPSIADGLRALVGMSAAQLQQMGECGRRLVETKYSWEKIARQMAEVYDWTIGGGPIPGFVDCTASPLCRTPRPALADVAVQASSGLCELNGVASVADLEIRSAPVTGPHVAMIVGSVSRHGAGVAIAVRALAQSMSEANDGRLTVFGLYDPHSDVDRKLWHPVSVRLAQSFGPKALGYSSELALQLVDAKPDLAHTHGLWMWPSATVAAWSRRSSRPYVVSPHGMLDAWALHRSRWKKRLALSLYERRHLYGAACLHALCPAEAASIRQFGMRNPVATIPNGVSLPDRFATPGDSAPRLLFLGRLHPKKGLQELLTAWASLTPQEREEWRLVIAGWDDGGHEAALRRQIKEAQVGCSVELVGPRFGAEKEELLAGASAFVLSSFSEGLPMAVLEAWAYGVPVLMTDACNLPEGFAAEAAVRIEPTPESIAAGLRTLVRMAPGDLAAMGARGRALVEKQFAWPEIAKQMVEVYEWVLGGGTPPACVEIR